MKQKIFFAGVFAFSFFFFITVSLGLDDSKTYGKSGESRAVEKQTKTVKVSQGVPSVFFPSNRYKFNPVPEGTVVRHDFVVQNKGDGTLHINKVRTG